MEKVEVKSKKELRSWLWENHEQDDSVWLITYKKAVSDFYVSWGEVVDQLLCFGWIDSVANKVDHLKTMRLISKRKPQSVWSQVNKQKILKLIKEGLMTPAGLSAIERAKKDGSWYFLEDVDQLIIPDDLKSELLLYPKALMFFEQFPKSVRHAILYWIKSAKKPQTRESRIIEVAFLASENIRAR